MSNWRIFRGAAVPHDGIDQLPDPPPWRDFRREGATTTPFDRERHEGSARRLPRASPYYADDQVVEAVNTALYLRRPLLITGEPGAGKSTLADAVARELKLGTVLRWPVNSKTTLRDGLYRYDSLGRLEEAGAARRADGAKAAEPAAHEADGAEKTGAARNDTDLGRYVSLGPLGTALAPYSLPRVLLIDEIDKSDLDLPNDLLDVFEEGGFEIPELARSADQQRDVDVRPADGGSPVRVRSGAVRCEAFPFVILTSNGEREFAPAFLRRCVRLALPSVTSDEKRLNAVVRAHLPDAEKSAAELVRRFKEHGESGELATDQLLNALYLVSRTSSQGAPSTENLTKLVFQHLQTTVLDQE
ncbi:AAA family ATPase [Streptomyces globisporus]|uniref:AAA family ATPase n=1 Tax=Streptomyces globisporus TaxID=1908 RepID=UPI0037012771